MNEWMNEWMNDLYCHSTWEYSQIWTNLFLTVISVHIHKYLPYLQCKNKQILLTYITAWWSMSHAVPQLCEGVCCGAPGLLGTELHRVDLPLLRLCLWDLWCIILRSARGGLQAPDRPLWALSLLHDVFPFLCTWRPCALRFRPPEDCRIICLCVSLYYPVY